MILKTHGYWLCVCFFMCAQLFSFEATAASSKKTDFNQLVAIADAIIFGKCVAVESEWRKNKIYSYATIQVDKVIKGDVSSEIQIEYLGGEALHPVLKVPVAMNVSTGIDFVVGDEAVLMLRRLVNNRFQLVSVGKGKVTVIKGADGEKIIQSGMKKIQSKLSTKDNSIVMSKRSMTLNEFEKFILSRMKIEKQRNK